MYAIVTNNKITKLITNPKSLVIGDVRYPAKIFSVWSASELNAIGIYEVVTDSSNKKDEQYYINTDEQYTYADDKVTRSWGTATPRRLEDENATDQNGVELNPVVVIQGLKSERKNIVKKQASGLLEKTDWHNHKALDDETYTIPNNIKTYRANVRAKSNEMETQIDACTTIEQLETLYTYTADDDGVQSRPLAEFPEEI
nr:N-acetylmuramidase/lysin [uncultured Mediterranean phage uvMED]